MYLEGSGVSRNFWVVGNSPAKLFWEVGSNGQLKNLLGNNFWKIIAIIKVDVYWREIRQAQLTGELARFRCAVSQMYSSTFKYLASLSPTLCKKKKKKGRSMLGKRGFLIEKEVHNFRPKKTQTHRYSNTTNPTKVARYQYRLNMNWKSKNETKLSIVDRYFCATAYVYIRKREKTRKIVYPICVVSDYNITLSD